MTVAGIDVSGYQSETYDTKGLGYVFVKATEGTGFRNPRYDAQVAHARTAGLVVGHYHFAHHGNPVAEADFFLAVAQLKAGDVIAYDWEEAHTTEADRDAWVRRVKAKAPSHKVVIYCDKAFWKGRDTENFAADGLWIADPSSPAGKPDIQHAWIFHQYSEKGGIDHDVANFANVEALREWCGLGAPKPPVKKPPAKPRVSLAHVIHAARTDPHAAQGKASYPKDVKPVEAALHAEGLLDKAHSADGAFGTLSIEGYAKWQRACGYSGDAANGIPGHDSLVKLGKKHGFEVVA